MIDLVNAALWVLAVAFAVPCGVFCIECVLGALARTPRVQGDPRPRPRIAVLVPAHDESALIARTLTGLLPQLTTGDVLLVVADNCSDDTAAIARSAGATAIERCDPERRGKGYALAFGLDHLAQDPPEVVIIVDADCAVSAGALERIARLARTTDRPVQADYLMQAPGEPEGVAVISALAFLVRNRVRPLGLQVLGLPCLLTGTGMAFPWDVIRKAPATHSNLVEDMVMGLELARLGHAPLLCPDAHVTSELPVNTGAGHTQRRRWEHGHLATLLEYAPRLLADSLRHARFDLIALALDLAVPPLSLLVFMVGLAFAVSAVAAWFGASWLPVAVLALSASGVALGVLAAWAAHGRTMIRASKLLSVPLYVLWKLPLYFAFFRRGRHGTWDRTERAPQPPGD